VQYYHKVVRVFVISTALARISAGHAFVDVGSPMHVHQLSPGAGYGTARHVHFGYVEQGTERGIPRPVISILVCYKERNKFESVHVLCQLLGWWPIICAMRRPTRLFTTRLVHYEQAPREKLMKTKGVLHHWRSWGAVLVARLTNRLGKYPLGSSHDIVGQLSRDLAHTLLPGNRNNQNRYPRVKGRSSVYASSIRHL
jgi:hypothetical protein